MSATVENVTGGPITVNSAISNIANIQENEAPQGGYIRVTDLPSKYKFYPPGTEIMFKPYTFGELEQWSIFNNNEVNKIALGLSGITTTGIKNDDMILFDFLFTLLSRKLSAFSRSSFTISLTCPFCSKQLNRTLPLESVNFDDVDIPTGLNLPIKLKIENIEYCFSPITVKSYIKALNKGISDIKNATVAERLSFMVTNMSQESAIINLRSIKSPDGIEMLFEVDRMLTFEQVCCEFHCDGETCVASPAPKGKGELIRASLPDMLVLATPFRQSRGTVLNQLLASQV